MSTFYAATATDFAPAGTGGPCVRHCERHRPRRAQRAPSVRRIVAAAGLDPSEWTPRELRHSFVSLLSANGVRVEDISRLVGQSDTDVTERVYRHQLQAVLDEGTAAMDSISVLPARR